MNEAVRCSGELQDKAVGAFSAEDSDSPPGSITRSNLKSSRAWLMNPDPDFDTGNRGLFGVSAQRRVIPQQTFTGQRALCRALRDALLNHCKVN